jgi:hypothetical protein
MTRIATATAGTMAVLGLVLALSTGAAAETAAPTRQAVAPQNTAKPEINGTARVGETLTGTNGTWTGTEPISYSYEWIRCTAGLADCEPVSGATNNTYPLVAADLGKRLILSVTATNADGAPAAQSDATEVIAPAGSSPALTTAPAISGTPRVGQTLSSTAGTWSGTQPVTFAYQWRRCNTIGSSCTDIANAKSQTYVLVAADEGRTIRVVVTATNSVGTASATSVPTGVVAPAQPAGPAGQIKLPSGATSIPASSVTLPARLVVDRVSFSPNPVRSRNQEIRATFRVSDTRGFVVRDALVFVRSTPLVTTTPGEVRTGQDGTVTVPLFPRTDFPLRRGYNVQFFVRARKADDNVLAGVSTRRLVQVRTASAG